jgi:hypothetical protein
MRSSHTLVHSQLRARKMLIGQTSKHASKKVKRPSRGRESFPTFLLWRESKSEERAAVSTPTSFPHALAAARARRRPSCEHRRRAITPDRQTKTSRTVVFLSTQTIPPSCSQGCVTPQLSEKHNQVAPAQALKSHWQQLSKLPTHMPTHRTRHVYSPGVHMIVHPRWVARGTERNSPSALRLLIMPGRGRCGTAAPV